MQQPLLQTNMQPAQPFAQQYAFNQQNAFVPSSAPSVAAAYQPAPASAVAYQPSPSLYTSGVAAGGSGHYAQYPVAPASSVSAVGGPLGSVRPSAQAPLGLSEPTWDQKQTGVGCSRCVKEFTFLNRRHRCRCCFREFCGNCTLKNLPVPQFGHAQAVRVCDACNSHLSTQRKRCLSRLVPYCEDNIPDTVKLQALGEVYEMLTSGVEILEDSKMVGMFGPLLHVVEASGDEKPNLRAKALSIISLLTDLDTTNCAAVAGVPGAIEKLVSVVVKGNPQARLLAAEILNALSRTKEAVESIVAADYVKHVIGLLHGQAADPKLLEVCSETLAALTVESSLGRTQILNINGGITNILGALTGASSLACQRSLMAVLSQLPPQFLVQYRAGTALVPLLKTLDAVQILAIVEAMMTCEDGPQGLLDAGILRFLVPEEPDPLVAVLILMEKGKSAKIAHAILPILSEKPDAGKKLCDSGQLGRLTSILHNHFEENMSLMVLRVLSSLAVHEVAVRQIVDTGGLYDLVNHMAGASASLQTAYLSVLQSMLRHKYCLSKATDAGAIQALVPLCSPPSFLVIRQMALSCLEIMCANESEVRVLVVGVATPASVVSHFLKEAEGLRLVRRLLEDPVTNADLMEAGIFGELLRLLMSGETSELRGLAASALALCIQQNTTVDAGYITAIADLMKTNGPEVGVELLAAFSAQPVYRQFIVQHGLVTSLIGLLLGGSPDSLKHAVLCLANLAYEDAGSFAIMRQGGVSVLVGLINHPVDQVQGCSLLALGNLCRTHECRVAVVRDGGADLIMEKFGGGSMSEVVENYCLWALRMLVMESSVPETLAQMSCLRLIFPKLAKHITQKTDSRVHALAFMSVMCAVPAFCAALSMFPGKQDLLIAMVIEAGAGRTWALNELSSIPIAVLLQAPGFTDALSALLGSSSVTEQRAGLDLAEQTLALRPDENWKFLPFPLIIRLLPLSARVVALTCSTQQGHAVLRGLPGGIAALADFMMRGGTDSVAADIASAIALLCRDPENAQLMVKLGVVSFFAVSGQMGHMESLSFLCSSPECRAALLSVPNFVSAHLLPLLSTAPISPQLLALLTALLKEQTFKTCNGICEALLKAPNTHDVTLLDALLVLSQGDLFKEGAFERSVELLTDKNAPTVVRMRALLLIKRVSLHAGERIGQIPGMVEIMLSFIDSSPIREGPKASLFLLDLVCHSGCAEFLSQGGIAVLLKVAKDDLYAPITQGLFVLVFSCFFSI
jgi:hypothetical protein